MYSAANWKTSLTRVVTHHDSQRRIAPTVDEKKPLKQPPASLVKQRVLQYFAKAVRSPLSHQELASVPNLADGGGRRESSKKQDNSNDSEEEDDDDSDAAPITPPQRAVTRDKSGQGAAFMFRPWMQRSASSPHNPITSQGQLQLKKAMTWLGRPIHQLSGRRRAPGSLPLRSVLSTSVRSMLHKYQARRSPVTEDFIASSSSSSNSSNSDEEYTEDDDEPEDDSDEEDVEELEQVKTKQVPQGKVKDIISEHIEEGKEDKKEEGGETEDDDDDISTIADGRTAFDCDQEHRPNISPLKASPQSPKELLSGRTMHCKVLQVTNLASSKEHDYELDIRVNDVSKALLRGTMAGTKTTRCLAPPNQSIIFGIAHSSSSDAEDPFELALVVAIKPKPGIMKTMARAVRGMAGPQEKLLPAAPVVVGIARLSSSDNPQLSSWRREIRRYRLANPNNVKGWVIDVTVETSLEDVQPTDTATTRRAPASPAQRVPWTYYTYMSGLSNLSEEEEENVLDCSVEALTASITQCRTGGFLTIYVRNTRFPTWERFWVVLQDDRLVLYNFSYKEQRDPIDIVPLFNLIRVAKPSFDDQENVCLSRTYGLVLQFSQMAEETEMQGAENKIFTFTDHAIDSLHWRRALTTYLHRRTSRDDGMDMLPVNSKYLW